MKRNGEKQWNASMKGCCKRVVDVSLEMSDFEEIEEKGWMKIAHVFFKATIGMRVAMRLHLSVKFFWEVVVNVGG